MLTPSFLNISNEKTILPMVISLNCQVENDLNIWVYSALWVDFRFVAYMYVWLYVRITLFFIFIFYCSFVVWLEIRNCETFHFVLFLFLWNSISCSGSFNYLTCMWLLRVYVCNRLSGTHDAIVEQEKRKMCHNVPVLIFVPNSIFGMSIAIPRTL